VNIAEEPTSYKQHNVTTTYEDAKEIELKVRLIIKGRSRTTMETPHPVQNTLSKANSYSKKKAKNL